MSRRPRAVDPSALGRLALAATAACFSGPILRWADGPPLVLAAGRMLPAFLIALVPALVLWRRGGARALGVGRAVAMPMLLSTVMLAVHFAAWTAGVYLTSVASAVVLVNAHPLVVLGAEAVVWKERVARRRWVGAIVALAGIAGLSGADAFALGGRFILGDALAFLGAVTYAVYVLASARVRQRVPTGVQVTVLYGGCLALLAAAARVAGEAWPAPAAAPRLWLAFVLMALVPTMLGHTMVQSILDRVRPGIISIALLAEPVGASLLAWAFLGQRPALFDVVGGALALAGIAIALWPEGEPAAPALAT